MRITLSDHFTYQKLLRFTMPSIVMMIITSVYSIVDGFFVSNCVGKNAFAALNLIFPVLMALSAFGFMVGTGGSALIAKTLGEGKTKEANGIFSMLVAILAVGGAVLAAVFFVFIRPISYAVGATELTIDDCVLYGRILLVSLPLFMLQNSFQSFLATAEKPGFGLKVTVFAGLTNVVLDFLLVYVLPFGLAGAALATALSQAVGAAIPLVYFLRENDTPLRLGRPCFDLRALWRACCNGASEMVSNLSAAVVTYLFNMLMLKFEGEIGVAAITAILYGQFLFVALYLGYSIGVAPVFSFNYGSRNKQRLIRLYRISIRFVVVSSVIIALVAAFGSPVISAVFMQKGTYGFELTRHGGYLFSIAYLFCGTNIVASGIFTALSDGKTSALISFLRTFVFIVLSALLLPLVLGTNGVWLSIPVAEFLTLFISVPKLSRYFKDPKVAPETQTSPN